MACNLCPLALPDQVAGRGPDKPRLIVVGDYPNNDDEVNGRPFSAGRDPNREYPNLIIPRALAAVGVPPEDIYWAYALRCNVKHRAKQVKVKPQWLATCRSVHLEPALAKVDCPVILVCGPEAMKSLLPDLTDGVAKNREKWHEAVIGGQKRYLRLTFSPGFIQANSLFNAVEIKNRIVPESRFNPPGTAGYFFSKDIRAVQAKLKELGRLAA